MLRASTRAAYCLPAADQIHSTPDTKELDHLLAMHFGWWDVFVGKKKPVSVPAAPVEFADTFLSGPDSPWDDQHRP